MQTEVISEGKIQEKRGISSAVLKNIAVVTMLIDHIGAVIVTRLLIRNGLYEAMANQEPILPGWGRTAECTASTWQCVSSADLRSPFTVFYW